MSGALLKTMLEKGYEIYHLPDGTWAALITAGHLGHHTLTTDKLTFPGLTGALYGAVKHNIDWSLLPDVTKKVVIYCMPAPMQLALTTAIYVGGTWNLIKDPLSSASLFSARKLNPQYTLFVLGARFLSLFTRKTDKPELVATSASAAAVAALDEEKAEMKPGEALIILDDHFGSVKAEKKETRRRLSTASSVSVLDDYF